jgi:hypothetical protein
MELLGFGEGAGSEEEETEKDQVADWPERGRD